MQAGSFGCEASPRARLCQLDGTIYIQVGQIQPVHCDNLRLAPDVSHKIIGAAIVML